MSQSIISKRHSAAWLKGSLLLSVGVSTLAVSTAALAQAPDEIVVTGSRQVIQDAIALKRQSTQIVDGLSADEIGDIPALSIGEALESITGVTSHRENGGATEVSIRGLGPYLSSTTINGRIVGNGSGDRSVNFSQFPSELMNKLAVFKTQDASQIEGGVAGQIQIDTLKPLDYGKRRIQGEIKGNINPDQLNQNDTQVGDFGFRGTLSFVDQFEVGTGDIGISVGLQRSDISQPEAEVRSTSNFGGSSFACYVTRGNADPVSLGFSSNPADTGNRDCEDVRGGGSTIGNVGVHTGVDAFGDARVDNPALGPDIVFVPSQRHYRQNDTRDKRDALFGAVQWQPNDRLDINLDAQWSERSQAEQRNDLTFNGWKRNDQSLPGLPGFATNPTSADLIQYTDSGAITYAVTENTVEVQGGEYERVETFEGIGLNGSYEVSDRLTVSADLAYSNVERTEQAIEFRIQSNKSPTIEYDTSSGIPQYTLYDESFDPNDHSNYVDRLRVRIDNDVYRKNAFTSGRFDVDYDLGGNVFTNIEAGLRYAQQEFISTPGGADSGDPFAADRGRISFEYEDDGKLTINGREILDDNNDSGPAGGQQSALESTLDGFIAPVNAACAGTFPESDFLGNLRDGDLITFTNSAGQLEGTNSWGVFDARCIANESFAALNALLPLINAYSTNPDARENSFGQALNTLTTGIPTLRRDNASTINVQEDTLALYAMANYDTTFNDLPMRGNVGMRVVNTEVTSSSFRQGYEITDNGGEFTIAPVGDPVPVSTTSDYTVFLPSATAIVDVADDKLMRFGVFRAISRADPADMGFDRSFVVQNEDDGEPITNRDDLVRSVNATGNPSIGPLTSWNFDAGFEWYPNEDSILAVSGYHKIFEGGFENVVQNETFIVDGVDILRPVSGIQEVSQDSSTLTGVEITGSHRFSYLPGYLSGLGVKASYNHVFSDFEFEDSLYGDLFQRGLDGNLVQTNQGIVAPGGLPGLSENVFSGTAYYQIGDLDLSVIYKYRDNYFQPATSNGTRLRYIGDVGVWEARASYDLTDNFRVSLEAINIFDAEKEQFQWVDDNQYEVNSYGPRIFFGLRGRF